MNGILNGLGNSTEFGDFDLGYGYTGTVQSPVEPVTSDDYGNYDAGYGASGQTLPAPVNREEALNRAATFSAQMPVPTIDGSVADKIIRFGQVYYQMKAAQNTGGQTVYRPVPVGYAGSGAQNNLLIYGAVVLAAIYLLQGR